MLGTFFAFLFQCVHAIFVILILYVFGVLNEDRVFVSVFSGQVIGALGHWIQGEGSDFSAHKIISGVEIKKPVPRL